MRAIRAEKERRAKEAERDRIVAEAEIIRSRCQTLEGFIREFWAILEPKKELRFGWALRAMCKHLEAVTDGRIQFLMMTVPPGMMKSLVLVFWTAWEWSVCARPDVQVLATSYSQPNVLRDNMKLRRLVESEKFQALWPLKLRDDQNAKGKFENTGSGFSEARPFSSMTGGRGDRVKIDDPHSTETAESDAERQAAVRIFREGISDRLNDVTKSAIVIIMQRLHEQDVAAVAMQLDIGFIHLNLPMEFEPESICRTYVDGKLFFEDPRTVEGELLFPERFPRPEVERLKKVKGPYAYAGQYQQRPAPREGGLFKAEWLRPCSLKQLPKRETLSIYGASDYAVTANGGDYTVHGVIGLDTIGRLWLVDLWRSQSSSDKWVEAFCDLVLEWRPEAWAEETGQIRSGVGPFLDRRIRERSAYVVREKFPTKGDKAIRAQSIRGRMALDGLYVPIDAPWYEAFVSELLSFPAGKNDDQVDMLGLIGQLLDLMYEPPSDEKKEAPPERDWFDEPEEEAPDWRAA